VIDSQPAQFAPGDRVFESVWQYGWPGPAQARSYTGKTRRHGEL